MIFVPKMPNLPHFRHKRFSWKIRKSLSAVFWCLLSCVTSTNLLNRFGEWLESVGFGTKNGFMQKSERSQEPIRHFLVFIESQIHAESKNKIMSRSWEHDITDSRMIWQNWIYRTLCQGQRSTVILNSMEPLSESYQRLGTTWHQLVEIIWSD